MQLSESILTQIDANFSQQTLAVNELRSLEVLKPWKG